MLAIGYLFDQLAGVKSRALDDAKKEVEPQEQRAEKFKKAWADLKKTQKETDQIVDWMADRYYWADILGELRQVLVRVETATKGKLRSDDGVWIEQLTTTTPSESKRRIRLLRLASLVQNDAFMRRYSMRPPSGMPMPDGAPPMAPAEGGPVAPSPDPPAASGATNEVGTFTVLFRAVSLTRSSNQPDANKALAYAVVDEIAGSPLFEPAETKLFGTIGEEQPPGTFTFNVTVKLKRPLKL